MSAIDGGCLGMAARTHEPIGGPFPVKLRTTAVATAACTLVLAGCGGDGEATTKSPAAGPSLDDAKAVVIDYLTHAFVGDPAACEHESAAYSEGENAADGSKDCAERIESIKVMLTDDEPLMDVSKTEVTVTEGEDGDALAEVEHEWEGTGSTYRLVVEDGAWKIAEDLTFASGPGGDEPGGPRQVSEEEAVALAETFCQVEVGVSRADVEGWMGAPDEVEVDDDGQDELSWYVNQDSYTVWFEGDAVSATSSSTPREVTACEE